jgi:imidazolonepropionase-like amidohydrolase
MKLAGVLASALLLTASAFADPPSIYAIKGGTVHRVSGAPIAGGTVIVRNGLIEAVGSDIAVPDEATVIDTTGMHVYPGLFDASTKLGLNLPKPADASAKVPKLDAGTRIVDLVALSDDDRLDKRSTGVTSVLIAGSGEVFNGQSVIINLGDLDVRGSVVRSPAATHVGFATKEWGSFPDSLMGAIYHVRQTFMDARQQESASAIYARNPGGKRRPPIDPALEALGPYAAKRLPVVMSADSAEMIARALRLSDELGLRVIVEGVRSGYDVADALAAKKADVLVSVDWPKGAPVTPEDEPIRLIRWRLNAPTTPAVLAKKGVRFALVSSGAAAGDYVAGIRKAVRNGLSPEAALRAVTLTPAEIFGVDRQIGSIDRGKIANLVVTDKPFFDEERAIKHLFVDGRLVGLKREEPKEGEGDSPLAGTWTLDVRTSSGPVAVQVTFQGSASNLTGSFSGDRGSGELSRVSIEGSNVTFSFSAKTTESGETSDWSFAGTLQGNQMTGNVTTTVGTFPFTGSKPQ